MGDDVCSNNHNQTQTAHILCRPHLISLPLCRNTLISSARQLTHSGSQFSLRLYFSTIITQECSRTTTNNSSDCEGNVACSFPSVKHLEKTHETRVCREFCAACIHVIYVLNSRITTNSHEIIKTENYTGRDINKWLLISQSWHITIAKWH